MSTIRFSNDKSNQRFARLHPVHVPNNFLKPCSHLLLITDTEYYAANEAAIDTWVSDHGGERNSFGFELPDNDTLLLFLLRWGS
jgi:hypothetical protein